LGRGVRDGGVNQARWSRPVVVARGGAVLSLGRGGVGRRPWHRAMGADERSSGDSDGGAPVMATTNFGSLVA
jgi:hypothetical protein